MIINDPDAFKTWLTAILEPLCDADPSALAKYVYALCKKDRTESELRESMLDQLDVFLQTGTKPFVEKLMRTLETQDFRLPSPDVVTIKEEKLSPIKISSSGSSVPSPVASTIEAATPPRETSPASPTPTNQDKASNQLAKVTEQKNVNKISPSIRKDILQHSINTIVIKKERETSKEKDAVSLNTDYINGSIKKERDSRKNETERDDRRRHRSRTRSRSRSWERSRRSRSRDRRERDKSRQWRNKSPPTIGATGHAPPSRRYRPSPPPRGGRLSGNNRSRSGNRYRNRSPSPPLRSRHSKPRDDRNSRSRTRSRSRSRTTDRDLLSGPATPTQDSNHGEPDLRLGSTAQSIQSVVPLKSLSQRCRDYDEKGYCMKGDLCPYDHGVDPVILQDVNLPGVLAGFAPSTNTDVSVPVPGTVPPPPPQQPVLPRIAPPPHSEYNPDAPAMWHPGQPPRNAPPPPPAAPFIRQGGPRYPPHGATHPPPHMFGGPAPPFAYGGPRPPPPPTRELIAVPVVDDVSRAGGEVGGSRGPKRAIEAESIESLPKRKGQFDFNRLGPPRGAMRPSSALELKKVPRGLNTIEHLNNHFSRFGKIVNIQISYEGDPEGAIVTFSTHAEANAAYRSTEAVLNNRFIKVFWHNPETKNEQTVPPIQAFHPMPGMTHNRQMIKDNTGGGAVGQPNSPFAAAVTVKDTAATATGGGAAFPPTTHPTANRGEAGGAPATDAKAQAISAIQKNQAALAAQHALRKKKEESRKEALAIAKGLSKRKQDLLQGQLKQQRLLIERLEKAENQSQRDMLMTTIKTVQESIEKLQTEIKAARDSIINTTNPAASANLSAKPGVKPNKLTKEQAQKEILDAELEIFTKQQSGADISALQRKVVELRAQVPYLKASFPRGRGGYRGGAKGPLGRMPHHVTSVDRRPTKLLVTGFERDEADHVVEHLKKFGEVSEYLLEPTTPALSVRFAIRVQAEHAMVRGQHFREKLLSMTWISENNKPDKAKSSDSVNHTKIKRTSLNSNNKTDSNDDIGDPSLDIDDSFFNDLAGNDLELQGGAESDNEQMKYIAFEESLLQEEDEDDEETEDRSWRR